MSALYKHLEPQNPFEIYRADSVSHELPHVVWVSVMCHVWLLQLFFLCLSDRKNVLNKELFCTILVGSLIILIKEVNLKTNCLMYALLDLIKTGVKGVNEMKACQLFGSLLVVHTISQLVAVKFGKCHSRLFWKTT